MLSLATWLLTGMFAAAAPNSANEALPSFPGTHAPQPAVWEFGPMEGNVQAFRVTLTGFGVSALPEGLLITVPGQVAPRLPGLPDLPLVATLLRGQAGKSVRVEVNPPRWITMPGINVAPAESPALDETTREASETGLVRTPVADVYGVDEFWPAELFRVEEAWIGTQKRFRLECALMQVNPVTRVLRYTLVLEGRLVFEADSDQVKP